MNSQASGLHRHNYTDGHSQKFIVNQWSQNQDQLDNQANTKTWHISQSTKIDIKEYTRIFTHWHCANL